MPTSRFDPDPAMGDAAGLDDGDANARDAGYADGLEYAGFWIRLFALVVDTILLFCITTPVLFWIYGPGYRVDGQMLHGPMELLLSYIAPAVGTVLFWRICQATPGKMLFSLRVVDARTGDAVTVGQAVARYLCYILSALPLCLGFIWVAADPRKQGWHDKIAQTVVVRARLRGPEAVRFGRSPASQRRGSGSTLVHSPQARWIVGLTFAVALVLTVAWIATSPEARWVEYREGILSEYHLMPVPVHRPYPPDSVCYNGYLERVGVQTHTSHPVTDDHGRSVPCLP